MRFVCQFISALTLLPLITFGQVKSYTLYGTVKANSGEIYPYHVVFDVNGSTLSGYSVTKQPTGADFKALITGHINRNKHTLTITEIKSLDVLPKDQVICMFDAKLTYKLLGSKYLVSGTFTGKNNENNPCADGTMEFEQTNAPGSVFYVEKKAPPPPAPEKPKTDTPTTKEPALPPNTITEGVQKQIDWTTDTCVMEIWDGGVIDGDVVTVLYNNQPVLTNYTLEKAHKRLRIPLTKKASTITVIAEDEGINPPNTADILFIDGSAFYKLTAYNKKGKQAIIIITKK